MDVVARGLSPDPHDRGSAAAFALDLRHACRPEPVRLPRTGVPDEELGHTGRGPRTELTHQVPGRHRRNPEQAPPDRAGLGSRLASSAPFLRRVGVLSGTVAVLGLVVWLGGWWGSEPSAPAPDPPVLADRAASAPGRPEPAESRTPVPAPAPAPAPVPAPAPAPAPAPTGGAVPVEDWAARLTELYQRRAEALSTGSAALLEDVYAPDSALLAADRDTVSDLAAAGESLRGFAPEVVSAAVLDGVGEQRRVTLRVVDRWPAYEVVRAADPGGPVLRPVEGRGEAEVRMTLEATVGGWRIASAERVA